MEVDADVDVEVEMGALSAVVRVQDVRRDTYAGACHVAEHRRVDSSLSVSKASFPQEVPPASRDGGLCVPGEDLGSGDPDIQESSHRVDLLPVGAAV